MLGNWRKVSRTPAHYILVDILALLLFVSILHAKEWFEEDNTTEVLSLTFPEELACWLSDDVEDG